MAIVVLTGADSSSGRTILARAYVAVEPQRAPRRQHQLRLGLSPGHLHDSGLYSPLTWVTMARFVT